MADLKALIYGTREYCFKSGFDKLIVGLSGGADSSLVAWIAAKAIGGENVIGVSMNSDYNSKQTVIDLSELLDSFRRSDNEIRFQSLSITDTIYHIKMNFMNIVPDRDILKITEENFQARLRGLHLMGLSNNISRSMVAGTGNKSELAVGNCTLYGDMNCGLAIISDVYKTDAFKFLKMINIIEGFEFIPNSIIEKAPSAELWPNQLDTDDLPEYDVLDPIIQKVLSHEKLEHNAMNEKIFNKIRRNEFKRKQAAPGLKISRQAFGGGRRYPILSSWSPFEHDQK